MSLSLAFLVALAGPGFGSALTSVVAAVAPERPPPPPPPSPDRTSLPSDGVAPLSGDAPPRPETTLLPPRGVEPIEYGPPAAAVDDSEDDASDAPPEVPSVAALPLGRGPPPDAPSAPPDPWTTRVVRLDFLLGPVWRLRPTDTMTTMSVEVGPRQGFSLTFHTSMIVASERDFIRVLDVPIGFGAVARGELRRRPLWGSVGLSAGILVHRAKSDEQAGVIHRVDPDLRLPLYAGWRFGNVGPYLALVPAYSVRRRSYERRGVEVWNRHSVRIALMIGLHWDTVAGRAKRRWPDRRADRHD